MDLNFTEAEEAFRAEAREWLEANVPTGLPSGDTREGFDLHVEWEKKLFEARWSVVSWPEEYGGRGASLWEWLIFEEEYYRAGGPQRVTQNGIFLLAPTIFEFGSDEQKARFLPRMAAADDLWCQGWSEPDAGSDLAGIKSRATRDDAAGGWVLNGQKTWTTRGAFCNWLFGLFRTDPDAARHSGMTYLLVPLDADGITVRGVERLDGDEGFAEVFLDDVFVPDDLVLGGVNEGWGVAMATTSSERGLTLRSPGRFCAAADRLVDLWKRQSAVTLAGAGDLAAAGAGDPACAMPSPSRGWRPRPTASPPSPTSRAWWRAAPRGPAPASPRSSGPSSTCASTRRRCGCSGPPPSWSTTPPMPSTVARG